MALYAHSITLIREAGTGRIEKLKGLSKDQDKSSRSRVCRYERKLARLIAVGAESPDEKR